MALANCKNCGQLFIMTKSEYCSGCQAAYDKMYMQVRDFLRVHPRSTVMDVHAQTGIPVSRLLEIGRGEYMPFAR